MFNTGQRVRLVDGLLDHESRRLVARRVLERLDARERHGRKQYALRTILRLQARAVASHVRAERPYRAFTSRW
jgi:CRISPR/Cas system-associated endonuclease Cas1